jgi:preprotein translocase subunit SecY
MWFAELITEENLGNGSSMIIFINIVGSLPNSFSEISKTFKEASSTEMFFSLSQGFLIYLLIVYIIVLFQDAYKKINIVSAKQLNVNASVSTQSLNGLKTSYIPIKINQGGIMPLVFSSTIATFLYYPLQILASSSFASSISFLPFLLSCYSFLLNIVLVIFFSGFYALLVLKPSDISQNLAKMAYNIPGVRQGNQTTQFLKQTVSRLAFMGGLFLAFLAFFPIVISNIFHFNFFKNVTSLLILVGVITDVTSQIRAYLISRNYEGFKKA